MTSIDDMAAEIMHGLTEYADLADSAMKAAVKKTATSVKKEISANAPKRTGRYAKSWATKKTRENSHTLEMTVHSKRPHLLISHFQPITIPSHFYYKTSFKTSISSQLLFQFLSNSYSHTNPHPNSSHFLLIFH